MLIQTQALIHPGSVVKPVGKGIASILRHHDAVEPGLEDMPGEGFVSMLELIAALLGASYVIGVGLNQLGRAPEGGSSHMPIRCKVCPASIESGSVVEICVHHSVKPVSSMEMHAGPQADQEIAWEGFGCPLERSNVPSNIAVDMLLDRDADKGQHVPWSRTGSVADNMERMGFFSRRELLP